MKTFLTYRRFLAVVAFIITSVSTTWAFDVDGMSYQTINSTEVRLTKGLNQAEVVIPEKVTYNGVTYTVTEIGRAFYSYKNTKKIVIPGTVRTIGDDAFYDNYYLEEVEFNEGLETIGRNAFGYAFPLKEIRIPSTVTSIGYQAFITNRTNLATIYCYASTPPTIEGTTLRGRTGTTLHVAPSDVEAYKNATYWREFSVISGDIVGYNRCYAPVITYDNYRLMITTQTEGATIYYTTDGSNPDENSLKYTGAIKYIANLPIRAIAIKD